MWTDTLHDRAGPITSFSSIASLILGRLKTYCDRRVLSETHLQHYTLSSILLR